MKCDFYEEFLWSAEQYQNSVALRYMGNDISYKKILGYISYCSTQLRKSGVKRGDCVAFYISSPVQRIISMLSILHIGAVCVPIYEETPNQCIREILIASGCKLMIVDEESTKNVEYICCKKICLHLLENSISLCNEFKEFTESYQAYEIAFFMYTSGTTGKSKGVFLRKEGISNHIKAKIKLLNLTHDSVMCLSFNISFVAAIWQLLTPLVLGAQLQLYSDKILKNIYQFIKCIDADNVQIVSLIPQFLDIYLKLVRNRENRIGLKKLKYLISTGDVLNPDTVNSFYMLYENVTLVNAYGMTECSDDIFHYVIPNATNYKSIPIGNVIDNVEFDIDNETGELLISGKCMALMYSDMKERVDTNSGKRIKEKYRTGDIVYKGDDGMVYYLGRIDRQVKVRGYKVNLQRVESVIAQIEELDAVIVYQEKRMGELVCVYSSSKPYEKSFFENCLKENLPDYMIPTFFVWEKIFPISVNGKIDRNKIIMKECCL